MTLLGHQFPGSCFGCHSSASLAFSALSLRLTGKPSSLSCMLSSISRGEEVGHRVVLEQDNHVLLSVPLENGHVSSVVFEGQE